MFQISCSKKKMFSNSSFNDNLLNSLNNANSHKFWQLWKANFNKADNNSRFKFQDLKTDFEIANYLADSQKASCSPNSSELNSKLQQNYFSNKATRNGLRHFDHITLSTFAIDKAISDTQSNTASGADNICIEHLKLAHPSVILILKNIFNIFLSIGEVPTDFGVGIVIPIPKFKGSKVNVSADDFRGITLNSILSKIFERCILPFFNVLSTSSRQFGFKKGLSCMHAINTVKNTIQFFNKKGNSVNLGLIDVRKAFDKVSVWGILILLQNNDVNSSIIDVMEHWFRVSVARVKWNDAFSMPIALSAGVRQGSILSPLLFSVYINILLIELEKTKLGCFINGRCFNSFLYADDLLLLSISVVDLQLLVDKCSEVLLSLDLQVNIKKSMCLRIGKRFKSQCKCISINDQAIEWVSEAKYLGVTLKSGLNFSCDWHASKRQFFKAVNSILGALGPNPTIQVALSLFRSNCVPILTYGLAAAPLSKAELQSLTFAYNNIFYKLFKTSNSDTIEQCQFFCGFLPLYAEVDYWKFCFLQSSCKGMGLNRANEFNCSDLADLDRITCKYNLTIFDSKPCIKYKIWNYFENSLT